jgi:hypothetical protein
MMQPSQILLGSLLLVNHLVLMFKEIFQGISWCQNTYLSIK